ncbi:hypothetical protein [Candidatus Methylocalor cossyra]|uniref:Uncharacterized protein n=1 Tax=Candidatus Methylocalor cossyra TaxID=3108543 RepID=A0ABM9NMF5_9GAMM
MIAFLMLLVVLSPIVFLIGLVKPKWILFWMKEPDRLWASSVGLLLFMVSVTLWSKLTLPEKSHGQREALQQRSVERQNELRLERR